MSEPIENSSSSSDLNIVAGRANDQVTGGGNTQQRPRKSAAVEFTGAMTAVQFRLPTDLIQSLRLLSYDSNRSMSDLVLEYLTTSATVQKCWVATRKAG